MTKAVVYNTKGEKRKSKISLPKEIFGAKINKPLMAQSVRVFLANQRQAPAKTLRRGEIKASGRKIYRQKGTGRARHGDIKAPIFVKGAKAHGPTGKQNFKIKVSKKMRKKAFFSALASQLKEKNIFIVAGLDKIEPKTKKMADFINLFKKKVFKKGKSKKITIVLPEVLKNIIKAGRNIQNVNLVQARQLNTYTILNSDKIIILDKSVKVLKETFISKK